MKFLRNRLVSRTITVFLLLVFVQSLILPNYAVAFTGPHQPEYTAYEAPSATDMVNLLTGDFSFSLPVLDVPGPEGGFSLPLSYNAGIGLDQEASWVGLGWSLNAGAITRSINEFPDDASGEYQTVTVKDLTGLRGWNAKNLLLGNMGWNNQNGHYGSLSLLGIINADWSETSTAVGVIGFNVGNDGIEMNPVQFYMGVATILTWGAAAAAAGTAAAAKVAVAKQIAVAAASNVAISGIGSIGRGNSPSAPTAGYWAYNKTEKKNWGLKILTGFMDNVNEYKIWLDKTRAEDMFGTLYLGNAPVSTFTENEYNVEVGISGNGTNAPIKAFNKTSSGGSGFLFNQGAASDVNYVDGGFTNFKETNVPAIIAADNFSVKAPGLSGSIAPYRLEVGSVSLPREMTAWHDRLVPVQYLPNDDVSESSYKVPFRYRGQLSNAYYHHTGSETSVSAPGFYWGLGWNIVDKGNDVKELRYDLNDVVLENQRIAASLPASKKIPASRHIEWLSNKEIKNATTYGSGFLDFLSGADRSSFRTSVGAPFVLVKTSNFSHVISNVPADFITSNNITPNQTRLDFTISFYADAEDMSNGITSSIVELQEVLVTGTTSTSIQTSPTGPLSGFSGYADIEVKMSNSTIPGGVKETALGGFSITREDGITYHFALPTYDSDSYVEIVDVTDNNKRSVIKRPGAFANAWLMTAVTGPDFIDRNANGIADDGDWGHWVKLHYGIHSNSYNWRIPYSDYRTDISLTSKSFQRGKSQLVYLNSVETRSHIALFKKSTRADGRSIKFKDTDSFVSPLKLDEIILLTREHYKKLIDSFGMIDHTNKINQLFTAASLTQAAQDFISRNAEKRVQFSYGYQLCRGIPNTNNSAPENGKLTLNRVSVVGRNNIKIVPDYVFSYEGYNPTYSTNACDGFGMYTTIGTHHAQQDDIAATAWSLSKITTPLGSEINISYETDDYASISGAMISDTYSFNNITSGNTQSSQVVIVPHGGTFEPGDQITMSGYARWSCSNNPNLSFDKMFNGTYTVSSVSGDNIFIGTNFLEIDQNCSGAITFSEFSGHVVKKRQARKGGGVRVASITTKDELGQGQKIRYIYTATASPGDHSSGVISLEPYQRPGRVGYPLTPVLYSSVSVLSGRLTSDTDFHTRQQYNFETPDAFQYTIDRGTPIANKQVINLRQVQGSESTLTYLDYLSAFHNKISDRTSKIGSLRSVKIFNHTGTLVSSSDLSYTDQITNNGVNNYQGIYTAGTIMADRVRVDQLNVYHKINRTTVIEYPWVLEKIVNSKDGFQTESKNISWDLLSGSENQTLTRSALGVYVKTVTVPAYTKYGQMGPKAINQANKNMLSQVAATYRFRTDATGNALGLIGAQVQTWRNDWTNYRYYNGSQYTDYNEPVSESHPIWRKAASYSWKGSASTLRPEDGAHLFSSQDEFNFSAPSSNPLWQYTGEANRFDHFGMLLEFKDLNNIYTAEKMGYDDRVLIASASNAQHHEIAFSSAEDLYPDKPFFGGEVGLGNGAVKYLSKGQTGSTHTGDAVVAVSSGYSFVFKTTGLKADRKYRASVWTNNSNGKIYCKVNGGSETIPSQTISAAVNGWYRINAILPTQAVDYGLEIGVKSTGGSEILFDDFRFQPTESIMTCYVYPPLNFEFTGSPSESTSMSTYTLDNDNIYSRFEYNERGALIRTYQESIQYGVKKVSESKDNYRRFNTNQ